MRLLDFYTGGQRHLSDIRAEHHGHRQGWRLRARRLLLRSTMGWWFISCSPSPASVVVWYPCVESSSCCQTHQTTNTSAKTTAANTQTSHRNPKHISLKRSKTTADWWNQTLTVLFCSSRWTLNIKAALGSDWRLFLFQRKAISLFLWNTNDGF